MSDILTPPPGDIGQSHLVSKSRASTASLHPAPAVTRARASDRQVFAGIMLRWFAGVTGHAQPNLWGA